jgi:hypothetical protein
MHVQPYLFFDGRCEEAVEFYQMARPDTVRPSGGLGWDAGPRRQRFGVLLRFGGFTLSPVHDDETCVNPFARGERS